MALEEAMAALTSALTANTAAILGKAPAAGKAPAGKAPAASKITPEMVKAAVIGVKDAFDKATALAIIKKHAKVSEISAIKPANYQAVIDACTEKMSEQDATDEDAGDDDDEL